MSGLWHPDMTPEHIAKVEENRRRRMDEIDRLSPELRACVKDYGWTVVKSFLDHKITRVKTIRHIVERVLDEFSPTRGSGSSQGRRPPTEIRGWEPKE